MFQGTGSDVGKSTLVAGLARLLRNRGLAVRPFKPQNMSNNAAVTADGGEIGRAQALQARAAGVAPTVHMNPVLMKPQSETGAQVVVQGRVVGNTEAAQYQSMKPALMSAVLDSFARLGADARHRARRGCGLGLGGEPAPRRHCQHGLRPRRRRACRAHRRHRARRRHRQSRWHAGRAAARGCAADPGLHRQQVPRATRHCSRAGCGNCRPDRLARTGPRSLFRCRGTPSGRGRSRSGGACSKARCQDPRRCPCLSRVSKLR